MSGPVSFSPNWDEHVICCPHCGGDNLHVHDTVLSIDKVDAVFWCEGCVEISALSIETHKGNTFLRWRR